MDMVGGWWWFIITPLKHISVRLSSFGMMTSPRYGKIKMFQSTNQDFVELAAKYRDAITRSLGNWQERRCGHPLPWQWQIHTKTGPNNHNGIIESCCNNFVAVCQIKPHMHANYAAITPNCAAIAAQKYIAITQQVITWLTWPGNFEKNTWLSKLAR